MQNAPLTSSIAQGWTDLPHWGVLRAQGADADSFLHGQLTQDILGLDASMLRLGGYCTVKGRLHASFLIWRESPDSVMIAASADLIPSLLKRLSMFVMRAKCKLSDAGDSLVLRGVVGADALTALGLAAGTAAWTHSDVPAGTLLTLPEVDTHPRALWVSAPAVDAPTLPALPLAHWQWLEVRSALPLISAATSEQFVPQMVNFELIGGVNFKKGCFPGQEVVARSQYRGTAKRRSFLYTSPEPARAGQEVFLATDAEQPAGMVVNAASLSSSEHCALVEVKLAALASALHLGASAGPILSRLPMPYDVPLESAAAAP